MTSGCLDRKEVRGAIWGVHSTTDRPAGGNTGRLFLAFGGPVCADRISNCPLDRVLTYKNLIYLLNLQVVLNELTKAPFEPVKDTDLKHLTLKTAFLLALASGKHRSEIHAWVANKVSNLGQWEKVALFPSSDFIAKNQLAREGYQSVSPVTIPALTTIVDR